VIRNPLSTKKISTPTKPPCNHLQESVELLGTFEGMSGSDRGGIGSAELSVYHAEDRAPALHTRNRHPDWRFAVADVTALIAAPGKREDSFLCVRLLKIDANPLAQTLEVIVFAHSRITRSRPRRMRLPQKSFCNCESGTEPDVTRDSLRPATLRNGT
jgi:hypothetical protein